MLQALSVSVSIIAQACDDGVEADKTVFGFVQQEDSVLDRLNIVDCFDIEALRSVLREIDTSLAFVSGHSQSHDFPEAHLQ